jgi:hypothetical protein
MQATSNRAVHNVQYFKRESTAAMLKDILSSSLPNFYQQIPLLPICAQTPQSMASTFFSNGRFSWRTVTIFVPLKRIAKAGYFLVGP